MDDASKSRLNKYHPGLSKELCILINNKIIEFKLPDMLFEEKLKNLNELAEVSIDDAEHSMRIALFSEKIAYHFAIDPKALFYGALDHDYGKADVKKESLHKKTGFTKEDMEEIKKHPLFLLDRIGKTFPYSAQVGVRVHRHQENPYPEQIPESWVNFSDKTKQTFEPLSAYVAIADKFDAAITRDNDALEGGKSVTLDKAIETIKKLLPKLTDLIEEIRKTNLFKEHMEFACKKNINDIDFGR